MISSDQKKKIVSAVMNDEPFDIGYLRLAIADSQKKMPSQISDEEIDEAITLYNNTKPLVRLIEFILAEESSEGHAGSDSKAAIGNRFYAMLENLEFCACQRCASKPGMPTLCPSCQHNRRVIAELRGRLTRGMA